MRRLPCQAFHMDFQNTKSCFSSDKANTLPTKLSPQLCGLLPYLKKKGNIWKSHLSQIPSCNTEKLNDNGPFSQSECLILSVNAEQTLLNSMSRLAMKMAWSMCVWAAIIGVYLLKIKGRGRHEAGNNEL